MEPWYKVATARSEVREGRSFNPDEFAIALERVVAGTASSPDLKLGVDVSVTVDAGSARNLEAELRQAIEDLALGSRISIEAKA
jgi:hypothetical protein